MGSSNSWTHAVGNSISSCPIPIMLTFGGSLFMGGVAAGYALGRWRTPVSNGGIPKSWSAAVAPSPSKVPPVTERTVAPSEESPKMAIIVRRELAEKNLGSLVSGVAWTVLGMFKKLWKRRDEALKAWDVSGREILVFIAASEVELVAAQSHARAAALPTHTYLGDKTKKERKILVVGPAPETLLRATLKSLQPLAT